MRNHYFFWALTRFSMKFAAYFIFLPIMVVLFAAVFLGDVIGKAYYRFTEW